MKNPSLSSGGGGLLFFSNELIPMYTIILDRQMLKTGRNNLF